MEDEDAYCHASLILITKYMINSIFDPITFVLKTQNVG